jgi:L-aspartate oxidase
MTRGAGVVRSAESLGRAADALDRMTGNDVETANLLTVSRAMVQAATARCESRGTHTRSDHPEPSSEFLGRLVFVGGAKPAFVPLPATEPEPSR